ncbi:phosphate propanoyltransferase [Pelagibaculum spongiae]|uniref:Phosphate propanoyltransferase n=1 Tax=Pelagibaculum spongiae TaxID=2080658 RepID=A0A2V1H7M0_9GAMM|nr:phosphate propanoyltransferase [Pelagibaculum spongiae]PVZ72482.1 propanediol utilization protein [Pelagibaculum spongiae]
MNQQQIVQIIDKVIAEFQGKNTIPVEASGRHVHLCQKDVDILFGRGHQLTPKRELSQPGQYLCQERVNLIGPKGMLQNVAVLGPARPETQAELSRTDARIVGVDAPIRESGNVKGSPGLVMTAGTNFVTLNEGVIVARNHIHMTPEDAERLGVKDKDEVDVKVQCGRGITFNDVLVRVNSRFSLSMHIDFDEANAVDLMPNTVGEVIARSC